MKSSCFTGSLFLIGVLALAPGCGLKTNPVPPQTVVPKPIEDLRYSLDDKGATLTWTYPDEKINGDHIDEIQNFDLYRAEIPLADFCSSCPIPFAEPEELPGGATGVEVRTVATHVSGMLRSGNKYFFKVTSRTSWLAASADSNIITFVYHTPAAAPQSLKGSAIKGGVMLSWQPVTTLLDGNTAALPMSYQVLKSQDGKQYSRVGTAQSKTTFVDSKVQAEKSYFYKVESSMSYEGEVVAGSQSSAVKVAVKDVKPPEAVTGVTVIASATNIRVFWDSSNADDLAGYRIYRRIEGESKSKRVGEVKGTQTIFVDNYTATDKKVYYSVSAFDKQNNEGKRSKEATTRH